MLPGCIEVYKNSKGQLIKKRRNDMCLGFILWLIFIFFLCCGASGCIGFVLLVWTLGVIVMVIFCKKGIIKD